MRRVPYPDWQANVREVESGLRVRHPLSDTRRPRFADGAKMDWGQRERRHRWIRMITDLCVADDRTWARFRWRKETKVIHRVDCDIDDVSEQLECGEAVCRRTIRILASGVLAAHSAALVRAGLSSFGFVGKVVWGIGRTVRLRIGGQNSRE